MVVSKLEKQCLKIKMNVGICTLMSLVNVQDVFIIWEDILPRTSLLKAGRLLILTKILARTFIGGRTFIKSRGNRNLVLLNQHWLQNMPSIFNIFKVISTHFHDINWKKKIKNSNDLLWIIQWIFLSDHLFKAGHLLNLRKKYARTFIKDRTIIHFEVNVVPGRLLKTGRLLGT